MSQGFYALQQFNFQEQFKAVRSLIDQAGEPWFVAQDICDILEHTNSRMALQSLDDDEKGVSKVYTLGGEQEVNIINESGLYNLIFRSNKPQAKTFRKWVTSEVLPAIRRQGFYGPNGKPSIPEQPEQAWALWAFMCRQEKALQQQLRIIRGSKSKCLAVLQDTAPPLIITDPVQPELTR